MSDVRLGNQPSRLTVYVTPGDAFAARLLKADGTDWADGTTVNLVLGSTSFLATVDGPALAWQIDAATWAAAVAGATTAALTFGSGSAKVTIATGVVISGGNNGSGFGSSAQSFSAPGVPSVSVQPIVGPAGPGVIAGGASGTVLAKASSTDYDTHWLALGSAASHPSTDFDSAGAAAAAQTAAATDATTKANNAQSAATAAAATDATTKVAAEATARASAITAAVTALVNGAPGALDTLNELAAALGDDANFATTITNAVAAKAPLASPALTGAPTINGTPLAAILVVDNGDGTATVTTQGGLTIVDNGDGTSTITLAGASVTVGNGASVASVNGKTGTVVLAASDVGADASGAASAAQAAAIAVSAQRASNLSDLANAATARTNLGLGSAATQPSSAFDASGAAAAAQAAAATDATSKVATETTRATTAEALALQLAGGTMSGALAMGSNAITGVSDLAVSGLTGAASAARFVGATTSGPPVSGSFSAGDYVVDKSGAMWACVTAGSPGVWAQVGGSPLASGTQDMLGWTYDPATNLTTRILPSAATLILCRIALRQKVTVTNVHYVFPTVGNTLTNSFVALFKSDGTIIGQSADMSTAWGSGGSTNGFATPLAGGPFAVTPLGSNDFVWAAFYVGTATTLPSFGGGVTANSQAINLGTTTARSRYATIAQANTATLASFAPASIAKAGTAFYMGVS